MAIEEGVERGYVALLAAVGRTDQVVRSALVGRGLEVEPVRDIDGLAEAVGMEECGVALVLDEHLSKAETVETLRRALEAQPSWSRVPVLVLSRAPDRFRGWLDSHGERLPGAHVLERPMSKTALIGLVESALRARSVQYALRDSLASLESKNRALAQRNADLDHLGQVLAHDLRSPLGALHSMLQLMLLLLDKGELSELRGVTERGLRVTERMARLIADLLELARAGYAPAGLADLEAVDTSALVVGLREALQKDLAACHGELLVEESLPVVLGSAALLEQVFQNLVVNGLRYNDAEKPRVVVSAEHAQEHWVFHVRDNGRGIAPEDRERVFEQLVRVGDRRATPGTGLGLATCRRAVESLGGRIDVRDNGDEPGSTFVFTVPRHRK